jgi:chromosome segregation ATPase
LLILTNCTCKISEEDFNKLQDLRRQEASLNEDIAKKRNEKGNLEKELASRESEAKKCKEDQDFVQNKLAQWPNVWPDWSPVVPQPVEQPVEKKRKK